MDARSTARCSPTPPPASPRTVPLPVKPGAAAIRPSRMGKWRAAVLILVHAIIAAHIVQWLISGLRTGERRTVSPVEPSESMFTLELGELNAGFVFFLAAIVSTLLFGRWFCGWGCHVVALQDLCAWMMKKVGIHPTPWRSRLLAWVPLGLAVYMFVWPTARRELIEPPLRDWLGYVPAWVGESAPLHGFTREFIVEDFWKTFAPWHVAIPFLLICGFATVYFLGSKAFCTYGCPYGGFFRPIDRLSPVRIRVSDDCNHCGHCTAVCTSNVRVADEVRDFGMVVDPGCFKCMDCVSVCPNDALRVGIGRPAIGARPRVGAEARARTVRNDHARFDLSLGEELAAGAAFLVLFRGYRGAPFLGEQVPLLMAAGIAGVGAFMLHKTWRLWRDLNVRGPRVQLKRAGRVTPAGWCFAAASIALGIGGVAGSMTWVVMTAAAEHEAALDRLRERDAPDARLIAPTAAAVYSPGYQFDPRAAEIARRALAWLDLARPAWERLGAVGLHRPWDARVRAAWLFAVAGDRDAALAEVRAANAQRPTDDTVLGEARLMRLIAGGGAAFADDAATLDAVEGVYASALARDPGLAGVRFELASLRAARGKLDDAAAVYESAVARDPGDVRMVRDGATALVNMGRADRAVTLVRAGLAARPESAALMTDLASLLFMTGKASEAAPLAEAALRRRPHDPEVVGRLAECLMAMNRLRDAVPLADEALRRHPRNVGAIRNAAGLRSMTGDMEGALAIMRAGSARLPRNLFLRTELAGLLQQMGQADEALAHLRAVIVADPPDAQTWSLVWQLARIMGERQIESTAAARLRAFGLSTDDVPPVPAPPAGNPPGP